MKRLATNRQPSANSRQHTTRHSRYQGGLRSEPERQRGTRSVGPPWPTQDWRDAALPASRRNKDSLHPHLRGLARAFLLLAALSLAWPSPAIAADGDVVERVSFLNILLHGAEWPGVIIALLSMASVTIIIEHFWTIRRVTMTPDAEIEAVREMIENRRFKECIDFIRGRKSMFADVMTAGLRHGRHGFEAMQEAAGERAGAWSSRLFRRVEYLNIIGNLGPLMGLLGTVTGMIEAFTKMQSTHGAYKPEDLAGGIGLALANTFLGLAVAIVSLGLFGVCRNRVDALTVAAHASVIDLLEYFRPAAAGTNTMTNAVQGAVPGNGAVGKADAKKETS